MFLLRSVFWLGVAFVLVKPAHMDLGQSGKALAEQTISASKSLATAGIDAVPCHSLECVGLKSATKVVLAANSAMPSNAATLAQNDHTAPPLPRPRLARPG